MDHIVVHAYEELGKADLDSHPQIWGEALWHITHSFLRVPIWKREIIANYFPILMKANVWQSYPEP